MIEEAFCSPSLGGSSAHEREPFDGIAERSGSLTAAIRNLWEFHTRREQDRALRAMLEVQGRWLANPDKYGPMAASFLTLQLPLPLVDSSSLPRFVTLQLPSEGGHDRLVMYRTAATSQYSCPRCLRPLAAYQAGVFVVDACLSCGGLFIDNAASRELVRAFDRDLVTIATTLGIGKGEAVGPGVVQRGLSCPKCGAALQPVDLPSAGVEIDVCFTDGTWFDANELPKVARTYRRARQGVPTDMASDPIAKILETRYT